MKEDWRTVIDDVIIRLGGIAFAPRATGLKQFHAETLERLKAISDPDILAELDLSGDQLQELNDLGCKLVWVTEQILYSRSAEAGKMTAFEDAFGGE